MTSSPRPRGSVLIVSGLGLLALGLLAVGASLTGPAASGPTPSGFAGATPARSPGRDASGDSGRDVRSRRDGLPAGDQARPGRHEAHDPLRPGNGGPLVAVRPAGATASLGRRQSPWPACGTDTPGRASGRCQTTLERGGARAQVAVNGVMSIDERGVLHLESGTATVTNLEPEQTLLIVDVSGRSFTVPPLGKVDLDEAAPAPAEVAAAPAPPPGTEPLAFDPRTGPPRLNLPPGNGPRPGPAEPVLAPLPPGEPTGEAPADGATPGDPESP